MTQPNPTHHGQLLTDPDQRKALRQYLLQRRAEVDALQRQTWDSSLGAHLISWCQQHQPKSMGVYWPIKAEPDFREIYPELTRSGIQLALPMVTAPNQALTFLQWQLDDDTELDRYGIPVPKNKQAIVQPEVLLIPCVGFNAQGFRLGYGGGFYDRTLAQARPRVAIGIAYPISLADFAAQEHDVAMDWMLVA